MPVVKGSPAWLRKRERDRLRYRQQRMGIKVQEPRKRVDPPALDARVRELVALMRGWTTGPQTRSTTV